MKGRENNEKKREDKRDIIGLKMIEFGSINSIQFVQFNSIQFNMVRGERK